MIDFGNFYDLEGEEVSVLLKCLSCRSENVEQPVELFFFNETTSQIVVSPDIAEGNYWIKVTLSDNNELDPKSNTYEFKISIRNKAIDKIPDFIQDRLD